MVMPFRKNGHIIQWLAMPNDLAVWAGEVTFFFNEFQDWNGGKNEVKLIPNNMAVRAWG